MTNVGKHDIARNIAIKLDVPDQDALGYVNSVLNQISKIVNEQGRLNINNFGKFTTRFKNEREGRNPKNGDIVRIKARRVVTFRSAKCTRS
jgi:DNA-binding protein HU-beta|tara:strand:- start:471 stop:743 length:273 start_codon:yes stop_codon:yes gene_type:complete